MGWMGREMGRRFKREGIYVYLWLILGSKITTDGDCSHEIKRHLLLGEKAMTSPDSMVKNRHITLLTKSIQSKLWLF